jgi:protein-S-isoprenylcysteine O-methyltransferase Ste14
VTAKPSRVRFGIVPRLAYASLFTVVLPVLLVRWARRLDALLVLPAVGTRVAGFVVGLGGVLVLSAGVLALWRYGHGLPMSPFPPRQLATRGIYRVLAHPIYVGAVAMTAGVAILARSPAGLWIVAPVVALAAVAWVEGFERDATRRRFGAEAPVLLRLPGRHDGAPTAWERAAVYVLVLAPWLVLYLAVERLEVPWDARSTYLPWESRVAVIPWSEAVYVATYPFVLLAPLLARRARALRSFAIRGAWATALIIPFYVLVPLVAAAKAVPGEGVWQALMRWERVGDAPVTAFPAFHVIWAFLAADLCAAGRPRWRVACWAVATAITVSCVTTGMHAIVDVVAGIAAYGLLTRGAAIWQLILRLTERIANSWHEVTLGPIRLLSHGLYALAGMVSGLAVAESLAGMAWLPWLVVMALAAIGGAGLWAQFVEGSPLLLRPYGYYGAVAGTSAAALIAAAAGVDAWTFAAAICVGGSLTQAIGRLRCLVQGCCHGRQAPDGLGIRYRHPRSRVVRLAGLGGVPLHPTPVYSMLWVLAVGAVLFRLWVLSAPLQLIVGLYLILAGAGRFVEEHFRGEPQTAEVLGLRLYQWLAIAFVAAGAAVTAMGAEPAPPMAGLDSRGIPILLAVGAAAYVAYVLDFPRSNRRLSRLA